MVHNFKVHGWKNHPEILALRENIRKRKVTAEEVAEIKAEIAEQRKVVPVVRVVEEKPFKPCMTIRLDRDVVPLLSGKR